MKLIVFVTFIILAAHLQLRAQSQQSDSLYAIGVELYNMQRYADAIPFFEKANQLDISELDSLSSRREYAASWLASSYYKMGDEKKAMEFDNLKYKLAPIDRRITFISDTIVDSAIKDIVNNQPSEGLKKMLRVSEIEHNLFDKDHNIHIGTNRLITTCYFNMKRT